MPVCNFPHSKYPYRPRNTGMAMTVSGLERLTLWKQADNGDMLRSGPSKFDEGIGSFHFQPDCSLLTTQTHHSVQARHSVPTLLPLGLCLPLPKMFPKSQSFFKAWLTSCLLSGNKSSP